MEEKTGYKSVGINYQQQDLGSMLSADLMFYNHTGTAEWQFKVFNLGENKHVYIGNLQETIELILLGKLCKEQLEELAKATQEEPIAVIEEA